MGRVAHVCARNRELDKSALPRLLKREIDMLQVQPECAQRVLKEYPRSASSTVRVP
jgi:hypothetical protein